MHNFSSMFSPAISLACPSAGGGTLFALLFMTTFLFLSVWTMGRVLMLFTRSITLGLAPLIAAMTMRKHLGRPGDAPDPLTGKAGSDVKLEGVVVEARGSTASDFTGVETTLHVHRAWFPSGFTLREVQAGNNFSVRLDDGRTAFIDVGTAIRTENLHMLDDYLVQGVLLDDHPLAGREFCEAAINPGDRIQIAGQLDFRVHTSGERSGHRDPPMQPVLVADPKRGLTIRRIALAPTQA